jgi:hypothetical protein
MTDKPDAKVVGVGDDCLNGRCSFRTLCFDDRADVLGREDNGLVLAVRRPSPRQVPFRFVARVRKSDGILSGSLERGGAARVPYVEDFALRVIRQQHDSHPLRMTA